MITKEYHKGVPLYKTVNQFECSKRLKEIGSQL